MLILIDKKMPVAAKIQLQEFGEVVKFATEGITYEAISGHPDIFFCPTPAGLIVAQNLPESYFRVLNKNNIPYTIGQLPVGKSYPESAAYNTLVTEKYIIQNAVISESSSRDANPEKTCIEVKQGYVRCNLIALPNNSFITSDRGIEKSLRNYEPDILFVDPSNILLDGFEHGFFGGACGLHGNTLFICGNLKYVKEKEQFLLFH